MKMADIGAMTRERVEEDESRRNVKLEHRSKVLRGRVGEIGDQLLTREGAEEYKSRRRNVMEIEHRGKNLRGRVGLSQIGDQLLPGIPDDITIDLISPKLPWIACQMLSEVSRGWHRMIQSRQIYDARVRSQSRQPFVLMKNLHLKDVEAIAVHSISDGSWYCLPPIPGVKKGMPQSCQCIALDCKLYVLGGWDENFIKHNYKVASARVYVLDLAGQRQWKKCSSMTDRRGQFGCGVMNGKIYVFGGVSNYELEPVWGSEVYDLETDSWSPIAPSKTFGPNIKTTTVGEELFVYNAGNFSWSKASAEAYHPVKDEWRSLKEQQLIDPDVEAPLVIGGKLHKVSNRGIHEYDDRLQRFMESFAESWKYSCLHGLLGSYKWYMPWKIAVLAAVVVNDEVLARVRCQINGTEYGTGSDEICLMRSQGLGCQGLGWKDMISKVVWQKTQRSLNLKHTSDPFLCLIHL